MYFKTPKNSETGKKFAKVYARAQEARKEVNHLLDELKEEYPSMTGEYRPLGSFYAWGGISSICFSKEPDPKVWRKIREGEYMPKRNSKAGKLLSDIIAELPNVQHSELNACIGHHSLRNNIGFNAGKKAFGFEVEKGWNVKIPADCWEILSTEYEKL